MSIAAGAVWEIRATGSDTNGGLFYSGQAGAGSDYSQQDAPQLSLTDVVTNGTTTVTSTVGGFTAAMIGNGINIAGTCYVIATRASTNSITVDRTIGAASGQTGKVGGALASPGYCSGQAVTANQIWMKSGSYTLTSASANVAGGSVLSPGGSAGNPLKWEGYQTTRGDKGTKPVIADGGVGGAGIDVFSCNTAYTIVDNIAVSSTNLNNSCFHFGSTSTRGIRLKSSGVGIGFDVAGFAALLFCEGANTTNTPFNIRSDSSVFACVAHGSSVSGFTVSAAVTTARFSFCLSYSNSAAGFTLAALPQCIFAYCTAYNNGTSGFVLSGGASPGAYVINCLATNNAAYGFGCTTSAGFIALINCAGYLNTSGNVQSTLTNSEGFLTLTGDPFVSAGTNFGLNNTSGAGAACRAAGTPGTFPGLSSTIGYPDLGAIQHQDSGGSGGGSGGSGRLSISL